VVLGGFPVRSDEYTCRNRGTRAPKKEKGFFGQGKDRNDAIVNNLEGSLGKKEMTF